MPLRIVIVGPGRVGSALGHRFARSGADLLGFVGRNAGSTNQALQFVGCGAALQWRDLAQAHVVLFSVGDADLATAVAAALGAGPPRACSLWLHTSAQHDLDVFAAAVPHGIRRGALHPVLPFADAAAGVAALPGAPAVWIGEPRSRRLMQRLCALLAMVPVEWHGGDRVGYHAACALAANGLTALHGLVERAFAAAGGLARSDQRRLGEALMTTALQSSHARGAAAALSGPVRRGDVPTIALHLATLSRLAPEVVEAYRALMGHAVELAAASGLEARAVVMLRATLQQRPEGTA